MSETTGSNKVLNQVKVNIKSEAERDLIVRTFKGNEWLLKELRALFMNLGVSADGKEAIKKLSAEVKAVIRGKFLPSLDREDALGLLVDPWSSIDDKIIGMHETTIYQAIRAQELAIELAETALALLDNPDGPAPDISISKSFELANDKLATRLLGRNQFLRLVSGQLFALYSIANEERKTPQELAAAAKKNSAR